jgi:hypothetical protein
MHRSSKRTIFYGLTATLLCVMLVTAIAACSSTTSSTPQTSSRTQQTTNQSQTNNRTQPAATGTSTQNPGENGTLSNSGTAGTITNINGSTLTIKTQQGTATVTISSNTSIQKTVNCTSADLQTGQFLTITGAADSSGSISASSIVISTSQNTGFSMPSGNIPGMTGTVTGFPTGTGLTTMTNTGTNTSSRNATTTSTRSGSDTTGTVTGNMPTNGARSSNSTIGTLNSINGNTLTITTMQNQQTSVTINSSTVIRKNASGTTADLLTGNTVTVIGNTDSNGNIAATSISISSASQSVPTTTVTTSAVTSIAIFSDMNCTRKVSTINWGNVQQGASVTQIVFLQNLGTASATVAVSATGLNNGVTLTADINPLTMTAGKTSNGNTPCWKLVLTLTAASSATAGKCNFTVNLAGVQVAGQATVIQPATTAQ